MTIQEHFWAFFNRIFGKHKRGIRDSSIEYEVGSIEYNRFVEQSIESMAEQIAEQLWNMQHPSSIAPEHPQATTN